MRFLIKDLIILSMLFLFKLGFHFTLLFIKTTISSIENNVYFTRYSLNNSKTTESNLLEEFMSGKLRSVKLSGF